jgi:hypothetical protein
MKSGEVGKFNHGDVNSLSGAALGSRKRRGRRSVRDGPRPPVFHRNRVLA